MIIIEIFNKKTNQIIETKELTERGFKAFMFYFSCQADTKTYDYRIVKSQEQEKARVLQATPEPNNDATGLKSGYSKSNTDAKAIKDALKERNAKIQARAKENENDREYQDFMNKIKLDKMKIFN